MDQNEKVGGSPPEGGGPATGPTGEATPASGKPRSIFRLAALEYYRQGLKEEGDVLHISPRWARATYWILVSLLLAGILYGVLGTLPEYVTGPALVRLDGRRDVTVPAACVLTAVEVQPGQHVTEGQRLATYLPDEERNALERNREEQESLLARSEGDPQALQRKIEKLRAELAESRLAGHELRAPFAGVVGHVRVQPGQHLEAGTHVLSLFREDAQAYLLAFFPGHARPHLSSGMTVRVEMKGSRYRYQRMELQSVGNQVIGPEELRRYLGPELSDTVPVQGPVVLARARIPPQMSSSQGPAFGYFDGLPAQAEILVRREPILLSLVPGLKGVLSDGD